MAGFAVQKDTISQSFHPAGVLGKNCLKRPVFPSRLRFSRFLPEMLEYASWQIRTFIINPFRSKTEGICRFGRQYTVPFGELRRCRYIWLYWCSFRLEGDINTQVGGKQTKHSSTMGHIREYYERIMKLQESEWAFIASHFERKVFAKNQVITRQGETENHLSFVEAGIVRFYIPDDENELTFNFSFDKEFTCAYDSFLTQTPSEYELQALTETVVWQISFDDLQKVYAQTKVGNYLGRFASEKLFLAKSKREMSLLKYDAKERYLNLFKEQPDILKFIPLKYVASYIGITPQGLSRIRRQIS